MRTHQHVVSKKDMAKIIAAKIDTPLDNENVRAAIREGFKETDRHTCAHVYVYARTHTHTRTHTHMHTRTHTHTHTHTHTRRTGSF